MHIKDFSSPGENRLAEAAKAASPAAWDYDRSNDIFLSNRRLVEIYGFSTNARLTFKDFLNATHRDDADWPHSLVLGQVKLPRQGVFRYRIIRPDGEVRSISNQIIATARPDDPKIALAYTGVIEDTTEQAKATHALTESETRLRLAIEAGKMAIWEVDLEAGTVTNTPELNLLFGLPKDARPTFAELRALYAPGEVERLKKDGAALEVVREQYARGLFTPRRNYFDPADDNRTQVQADLSIITPSGQKKHLLYRAQYTFNLEGRPQITGLLVDITEQKLAQEQLSTVAHELQHRVKNSLAIVQSLAILSFRSTASKSAAVETFQARLRALALATNLVSSSEVRSVDVGTIVEKTIDPYRIAEGSQRFLLKGPIIKLPEKAVIAMTMVLHELCTNAAKYGALSTETGKIRIEWQSLARGGLSVSWKEWAGKSLPISLKNGFGTQLIRSLVANDLSGSVELKLISTGLICQISTGSTILSQ